MRNTVPFKPRTDESLALCHSDLQKPCSVGPHRRRRLSLPGQKHAGDEDEFIYKDEDEDEEVVVVVQEE